MDERSARHTDLYLTTYNTYKRQASMPAAGFEPTIPASERKAINAFGSALEQIDCPILQDSDDDKSHLG
jgi:hypothetical protein